MSVVEKRFHPRILREREMRLGAGRMKTIMDLLLQTKQQDTSRTLSLPCPNSLYSLQEEIP